MVFVPQSRATPRALLEGASWPPPWPCSSPAPGPRSPRRPAAPMAKRTIAGSYQMPFPCGQAWTGTTRSSHSPSSKAIDWNRPDDDGDDVVSSGPGTVTIANKTGKTGYGRYVQVTHAGGESTLYGHLSSVVVDVGSTVDQGTLLGYVGTTGNSTGPHLHYEQRLGSTVEDGALRGREVRLRLDPDVGQLRGRAPGRQHDRQPGRRARGVPPGPEVDLPGAAGRARRPW